MFQLPGPVALSTFRLEKLRASVSEICADVAQIQTQYVHFVDIESALTPEEQQRLESLLDYGANDATDELQGQILWVTPRPGTISPWSSKATDIAHNCGLNKIRRIERGIVYSFISASGT